MLSDYLLNLISHVHVNVLNQAVKDSALYWSLSISVCLNETKCAVSTLTTAIYMAWHL